MTIQIASLSDGIAFLDLVATAGIAVAVYLTSRRFSRLQVERDIRDAWIAFDQLALENDGALTRIDECFHPERALQTPEEKYRRWVYYAVRNPLEMMFLADTSGFRGRHRQPREALRATLLPLVTDEAFMELVKQYSESSFWEYCQKLRNHATSVRAT